MTPEDAIALGEQDPQLQALLADLPAAYARTDDANYEQLCKAFIRAAYGRGYIAALETGPDTCVRCGHIRAVHADAMNDCQAHHEHPPSEGHPEPCSCPAFVADFTDTRGATP